MTGKWGRAMMSRIVVAIASPARRFGVVGVFLIGLVVVPLTALAQPPNDNLASAIVIGSLPYSDTGTNVDATTESEDICTGGGLPTNTVWWTYTPPADVFVQIDTNGSDFDTQLNV
jgi:hypothetical protein